MWLCVAQWVQGCKQGQMQPPTVNSVTYVGRIQYFSLTNDYELG